ncbi:GNAT family N-acetyltransferase [Phenylobacterium sp.]|uniref:GNAT family N-acetyltransferase n=1 Tax=Phenylobacterium sp. TaxID=1871053 RepID=UPI00271D1B72|nr:GNAT family N-acetyltransferase [Phenylobacterium sp.]MDO8377659.1 GNAT family N-acetyltransferase [Phenylobacterium sp.]
MAHPLDRPVWSTLSTRQRDLALGDGRALRFDPRYNVFGAAADGSPENLAALRELIPVAGSLWVVEAEPFTPPPGVAVLKAAVCAQMVAEKPKPGDPDFAFEDLTEADAPQMLALATLTEPGPFLEATHRLGAFVGIKQDGRLVAMAGERMRPQGFTEVSGVCTHPDHRGRGHAGRLMQVVAGRITARGETPFLHSYASNTGAIRLYESLGFEIRREVTATVLGRG